MKHQLSGETPHLHGCWPNSHPFSVPIKWSNYVIGRSLDADLVVPQTAPYVSSRHAEIQRTPLGFAVVDLNSSNGTRINGVLLEPLQPKSVQDGDVIGLGSKHRGITELTFHQEVAS